ncbi:hypothetical protein ACROYT_G002036 [Oculina patagonica]
MPFREEYKQPSKEKLEKEDLKKPDKGIPSLSIDKADSHSKINFKKSVLYRHRATREISDSGSELSNMTCHSNSSCMGKCSTERDPGPTNEGIYCFCDEHCMVFQDCCADYEQACLPIGHQNSSRSLDAEQWQCNNNAGSVEGAKGVWMISACPAHWTPDGISTNCTGNMQHLSGDCQNFAPVTDERGNTYKNRFCALCHGVQANTSRFYDAQLVLNVKNVTQSAYNTSQFIPFRCSYLKWKPPLGVRRRYCLDLTKNESCLNNSSRLQDHSDCLSRPPGIAKDMTDNSKLYFNRYCALCAGVPLDSIACVPTKPKLIHGNSQQRDLSILLSPEVPEIKPCQDGHVLDPVSKKCKKALKNAKPSVPFLNRYTTTVQFRSRSGCVDSNRSKTDIRKALESALKHCSAEVFNIDVSHSSDDLSYAVRITVAFPEANLTQNIHSINCNLTIRNTSFLVIKGKWEPMFCVKIDIYKSGEYVIIVDADSAVYINSTEELIQKIDYWSNQTEANNGSVVPLGDIHVCRKTFGCSGEFVQLEEGEYVILSNGSLYKNGSHVINDFVTVDGKPAICIPPSYESSRTDVALVVISNVGIGLSVVCLLLVLITYSLFKELRTVPGVNLMNLCLSLLLAHSLLMAVRATRIRLICTSIAVLLHYFFLSSFVWMSIIAFDTYRTFSRTCHTRQRTGKLKARFFAFGWLLALVFVIICFSLDQSGLVAIGYGGRDHCWINNPKTNTFVFVVPVAFSILFNGLFFLLTVISIRKIKKQTQKVESAGRSRRSMVLFVKLAVLMGFTWVFGYLMILVPSYSVYFEYPFVIFTSLQGVYIAFGFVFTARVKKMYGSLFSPKSENLHSM